MVCEEKSRLLDVYGAKVSAHSVALIDISVTREKISKQEYDHLWNLAEQASVESDAASSAFYQHRQEHGC